MPTDSKLIQPLISTEAFSLLTTVVPSDAGESRNDASPLTSRATGLSRYGQVLKTAAPLVAADLLAISASYLLASIVARWILGSLYHRGVINNLTALCLCHLMVGNFLGLFPATGVNPVCELRSLLTSIFSSLVLLIALNGLVGEVTANEILTISVTIPLALLIAPLSRFTTRRLVCQFKWWGERVIIVGGGQHGRLVHQFIQKQPQRGLKLLGIVDNNPHEYWLAEESEPLEFLGETSELVSVCRNQNCHWVIAAIADKTESEVIEILTQGSLIPNLVVLNSNVMMPTMWVASFDAAGLSGVHIRDRLQFPFQRALKRLFDIVMATTLLGLLSLPMVVLYLCARSAHNGPALYCHRRIGRSGKPFGVWKITTMVPNAPEVLHEYLAGNPKAKEEWEMFHKLKNDPRVIPGFGQFLRRTSLDELPQLWNVLIGEMSLVGPRPVYTLDEIKMYGELYPLYLRVRPGVTGLWQVSGRNNTSFADKVWLDTYYSVNWSLWLDYFILLRTVRTVLMREGSC